MAKNITKRPRIYTVKKNDPLLKNPAYLLAIARANSSLSKRKTGQLLKPGDVIRLPSTPGIYNTTPKTMTTTNSGVVGGTSGGILAGGTGTGYGNKGKIKPKPTKPKPAKGKVVVKQNNKPKRTAPPPKPQPLVKPVSTPVSPVRPQVARVTAPQARVAPGYATSLPPRRPSAFSGVTAGVTSAYRPPTSYYDQVFNYSNAQSPVTSGGQGTVAPYKPQPAGMQQTGSNKVTGVTSNKPQMPKAAVNMFNNNRTPLPPTVLPMPVLTPDNINPPFQVIGLNGEVSFGTNITLDLLSQGIRPLVITPYDQMQLGLSDLEMEKDLGYTRDQWGNWIRNGDANAAPASGGGGNGQQSSGYGGYGGYGGGGYGNGGGGGYGYPSEQDQRRYGSEMSPVTWRI